MTISTTPQTVDAIRAILDRAIGVAAAYGSEIENEVREAAKLPLDRESAERLYARVLTIVSNLGTNETNAEQRAEAVENIRREAAALATSIDRPTPGSKAQVTLVDRNGLEVREVAPTPQFNGVIVPMMEGYVDVLTLDPWDQNHRVILHVEDFVAQYGRQPDSAELVGILQGSIRLQAGEEDPFKLRPLASSIARKGVERPPIITHTGTPHDGNRRIAASRFVLQSDEFTAEQKERARWIRVWQTRPGVTDDQLNAMVLALNFEEDHKVEWPEYVKAKLVAEEFRTRLETELKLPTAARERVIRSEVAAKFAIKPQDVTRYLRMVQWAEDFTDYHVESGKTEAEVSYRTNKGFQWFYELDAGPTGSKVTERFEKDPDLRAMIYDLMFDSTFESGAQVRAMYQVANDDEAYQQVVRAHQIRETQKAEAKELIVDAINGARERVRAGKAVALDQYALGIIKRLGDTPANAWATLDVDLLKNLRRTLIATLGAVEGELSVRAGSLESD
ncbi:hypothetical protein [Glaciihabitans sp. UYNi722]|uniref:hypothetical protein n=1 Tax=Glaciihabitans sp. UYNi722 TaxID=3156344 RepID=UPI003392FE46